MTVCVRLSGESQWAIALSVNGAKWNFFLPLLIYNPSTGWLDSALDTMKKNTNKDSKKTQL